jgi:tetratricopeptide (TPR) repeat protein
MTKHLLRSLSRWLLLLLLPLALALPVVGCGAHMRAPSSIASLRAAAAGAPRDAAVQRQLALAEIFSSDGDPTHVGAQLQRALTLDPKSPRLWFAAGLEHDAHGHPSKALDSYLHALALCEGSNDPIAPQLGELLVHAISGLDGAVPGYVTKVGPAIAAMLDDARLPTPALYSATRLLIDLAYRRGDRPAAERLAQGVGCVTSWRAAGPFGPRELLGFDAQQIKPGQRLADSYDLGPGRRVLPTRELGAKGCSVNLGGGPLARGGSTYAQSYVDVEEDGAYVLRFESPNASELFVDGRSVLRLDRRQELAPDLLFMPLALRKGHHELLLKLTTRHPNPALSIALSKQRHTDNGALGLPFGPQSQEAFAMYVRGATAMVRGDLLSARQILDGIDGPRHAAAPLLMLRASLLLGDPLFPTDSREDDARTLLSAAAVRDKGAWYPGVQLAGMMAGNGRAKEAIAALRRELGRFPEVPSIALALSQLLRREHWEAEADSVIATVRKLVPDACGPLSAELEALRERQREEQAAQTAEALERCEAQANARYSLLLRQRRYAEAQLELERLAALEPPQNRYPWILARLELAKNRGDDAAIDQQIAELRARYPRSTTGALEQVDRLAGRGDVKPALAALRAALASEPASMAELHRLAAVLGGEHVLAAYRKDGAEQIKRFEASGRHYEAPQVLVFDYMALRVFEDGSSIELVHTIQKAQSDEAVNDLAEVHVPEGAHVLTLHTIKADGQRLEPDEIEGKDAISLPTVIPGDYVELEYVAYKDPSEGFPGGYGGDRFYFKSFEIPFDHSQMVVITPKSMSVQVDPRGKAPKVEERMDGDLRVWNFQVEESLSLKPEPAAVSAREYLPSVRIGVRASWPTFVESIRDALADRDIYDPDIVALTQQIVSDADPADYRLRAQRLYAWVLEHIENNDDLFSQAAVMLRSRSGNRARVLSYMLKLAGVPAKLALVRSASADSVPSEMADGDTYEHLLVTFTDGRGPVWLFAVERWAPFGYLPPLLRGQPAMLLTPEAERVTVPVGVRGQDLREVALDITLSKDGSAHVAAVESVHGAGAVSWRGELESVPAAELEHRFGEDYVARLLPGARLTSLKITGREQEAETIKLEYGFELGALGRATGKSWALPSMLATHLAQTYAQLSQRSSDELLPSPVEMQMVLRIHLPKGAGRATPPEPVRLEAAIPGRPSYAMTTRFEQDALVIERKVELPVMRVTTKDYAAFATFCRTVDVAEAKELLVQLR